MSGTETETQARPDDDRPTRRPRQARQVTEDLDQDAGQTQADAGAAEADPTAEETLEDLRARMADSDARRAAAEEMARQASARADENAQRAHVAEEAAVARTQASIDAAIEASTSRVAAAKQQMRAAREAGDYDAEMAALDMHGEAQARATMLKAEKARMQAQAQQAPRQQQQQPQQGQPGQVSREAQVWLDQHPRFFTDPDYHDDAIVAHHRALRAGHADGSPSYVAFIDARMRQLYPENPGMNTQQPSRRAASMAAPPSRSTGTPQRGPAGMAPEQMARLIGGPDATLEDMAQFAEVNGFLRKDGSPDVNAYLKAQAEILEERKYGKNPGLFRSDEEQFR